MAVSYGNDVKLNKIIIRYVFVISILSVNGILFVLSHGYCQLPSDFSFPVLFMCASEELELLPEIRAR